MDPVTHTMVGATLSDAGGRRFTPLATTTLVLAANAPDVDIVAQLGGPWVGLAWRRGITHGLPALFVLPLLVLAAVSMLDRLLRMRFPGRDPIRPGPTLGLAFAGVLTHPFLDWLNTYGMRWLMPMDGRWFYGDTLFIIDPWLWLGLGGTLFLLHSGRPSRVLAWCSLATAMSVLVLLQPVVPPAARLLWAAGLAGFGIARYRRAARSAGGGTPLDRTGPLDRKAGFDRRARAARFALGTATVYILVMFGSSAAAERVAREALAATGAAPLHEIGDVMVGPQPADPFSGSIIGAAPGAYHIGTFHWLRTPRADFHRTIDRSAPSADSASATAVAAALRTEEVRNFLVWSRFPYFEVRETPDGHEVHVGDARYEGMRAGGLAGVTVPLDRDFRPL